MQPRGNTHASTAATPTPPKGCNPTAPRLQPDGSTLRSPCTQAGDQSRNDIFRQYGVRVLEALPDKPHVLLLTHGDEVLRSPRPPRP